MNQPELGKKIAELRKTRMLTQEELVDKCNISIRTIQRIESGEVTPRDYTIKTILAALDYDPDAVLAIDAGSGVESPFLETTSSDQISKMLNRLYVAFGFGIAYFLLRFVEGIAEYSRFFHEDIISDMGYIWTKAGVLVSFVLFLQGFLLLGRLFRNSLLSIVAGIYMAASLLVIGFDMTTFYLGNIDLQLIILLYSITFGAIGIVFGYALRQLPGTLGKLPRLAGNVEILGGVVAITVILSVLSPMILAVAELFEILMLYKAIELLRKEKG